MNERVTGIQELDKRLAYITGSGRSGSTLLDLLLNNHPQIRALGEVHRLNLYARENFEPCTCGQQVTNCPFWLSVEMEVRRNLSSSVDQTSPLKTSDMMLVPEAVGTIGTLLEKGSLVFGNRSVSRWVVGLFAPAHQRAIANALLWYRAVHKITGCPILVDSTKDVRRLIMLYLAQSEGFRVIHLVRDGRGVAASAMRREGIDMTVAARHWLNTQRRLRAVLWRIPARQILQLHYENLCCDPEGSLRNVCTFLGVPYDSNMLELRKQASHSIGGNPMRFRRDETEIGLDDRWRRRLSCNDLAAFGRIAGAMNRRLGYVD